TIRTLQSGQTEVNGLTLSVLWHPRNTSGQFFTKQAIQVWGGMVNWRTATAYDATRALIVALQRTPTRSGLQKTLRDPAFSAPGASAPVQFLPSGDRKLQPGISILVQVRPSSNPKVGYEFVPLQSNP
ncbi:MAG: hypothetical protein SFW36_08280, partial [Leptolyngbyaceae cyanobacterium bins.59]|nr:hypothetical protein [Leptolyngbyaceae cyanobacterium bins.59]